MNYLGLLKNSLNEVRTHGDDSITALGFLGSYIFEFTTYDGSMDELFGRKALEVCTAISSKDTFKYIEDKEDYQWFLLMVNMPFFAGKLDWGGSIRGAWWSHDAKNLSLETIGLFNDGFQISKLDFKNTEEWDNFICGMNEFIKEQ